MLIALKGGLNEEDIAVLAAVPVSDYKRIFKETTGQQLRTVLSGIFQIDRIMNATPQMREIPKRARMALKEIGSESDINKRRVKRFGVEVE